MSQYKNIVILTGAGISQESGLKTFRDDNGLWEGHRVEEVATPQAFQTNPELVHNFYNLRRAQLLEVEPNAAHKLLADWESKHSGQFTLITQNVDDLHERAGSKNVIHMHGELKKVRCQKTGEVFDWNKDLTTETPHPKTNEQGLLRPHICWFGEIPFFQEQTMSALNAANLFVAIGTSGNVYPASGFVQMVPSDCKRVLINKEPATNSTLFDEVELGPATQAVQTYLDKISIF